MSKRIMSERNLESDDCKMHIGTLDRRNPETFYVEGGTYISPNNSIETKESYETAEKAIRSSIEAYTRGDKNISGKCIISTEAPKDRLKKGKWSYMSFQIHFRQNDSMPYKTIDSIPSSYAYDITKTISDNLRVNNFSTRKNRKIASN